MLERSFIFTIWKYLKCQPSSGFHTNKINPWRKKTLRSLIDPSIKEGECYDAWNVFVCQCANRSSQIQSIYFDQSYSPVRDSDFFRINISIAAMHRLTASILDVSNAFHNTNFTIHERACVNTSPYYLDWFEKSHPSVPLNWYEGPFFLQLINGIQGTKLAGWKWNWLLDAVVTILKYKKSITYHNIYIIVLSDVTVSYLTFDTDDFINTTIDNETSFPELTRVFK